MSEQIQEGDKGKQSLSYLNGRICYPALKLLHLAYYQLNDIRAYVVIFILSMPPASLALSTPSLLKPSHTYNMAVISFLA